MGRKALKKSGFLPPEMEIKKEILSLTDLLRTVHGNEERLEIERRLHFNIMKLNEMRPDRPLDADFFAPLPGKDR